MTTIFTEIINKKIPSYIIYEDELVIAFLDINPFTKGHTLVATKKDYSFITEIPKNIFLHMFEIIQIISKVLIKTLNAKGINLLNNNGKEAGQTIFHYHVHLIPRFELKEISFIQNQNYSLIDREYNQIKKEIIKNFNYFKKGEK
ncbi:MAG: diadenosine tetraphosphate hydrolase [Candidatus Phytoplasma cynodontis]|uniref:HIT family protein n=1 Tax='Cynodon dactylon' phytoplasma TaxID=295320 RepID=UPI001265D6BA|nr:HIT family protein ['Cynodon dactylon' phytoplasma]KAB8121752.1 HIT family protein ['Cynodon dactylon' phytoplasma]WIA07753.1 MAG: diadenosine tetraphosphate hydrolase [Candidatus Phytoplasma cynodontis]